MLPTSAAPVSVTSSAAIASSAGASGGVESVAVAWPGSLLFSEASVAYNVSTSPLSWLGVMLAVNLPSRPTVPVPRVAPVASKTVICAPASAVPLTLSPVVATTRSVGAAGAVTSRAITSAAGPSLPALSVAAALSVSPLS
ncbi:hypothetical protein D3C76_1123570 [compost metagenome]